MLSYLIILATTIAGVASAPVWIIGIAAASLALVSFCAHRRLYAAASELGTDEAGEMALTTLLLSFGNALLASGAAYALGFGLALM